MQDFNDRVAVITGGGSGIGLAVARAVARTHGGDVTVADSERGARFEVTLPAREHNRFSGRS